MKISQLAKTAILILSLTGLAACSSTAKRLKSLSSPKLRVV